ncbi:hypothetical protein [Limosilactobacillus ingluviei]|uniref:Phage structural protein n=1 Tax=Limosilactobacillus ingluviei DSM 15946 TaxID=1423760 RepID=A0A0R1UKD8_9LACO|nr:hypothetical protein [Limosilactobacillus ingluviei]KRL91688.1 phage structural protein [Limosilactobacillus ingluviei DSM 15946]
MADETVNEEVINDPDYTYFEEVYRVFLGTIESYYFSKMDDEELSETLFGYLNNGISVFSTYISKDFTDLDQEKGRFNFKLSRIEITILARAMKLEWVRSHKYSQELMEKAIGDRDYAAVQGYQYLDRLSAMDKSLQREIKTLINELEYADEELYGDMLNG